MRSRTIREGSVGLFLIAGVLVFAGIAAWLKGITLGQRSYTIVAEFPDAGGLLVGGVVRYRGTQVGRINRIVPNSNGVDVTIEIMSNSLSIPAAVSIETNRTGLLGEASIDIIPLKTLSAQDESMSPIDSGCKTEIIVCDQDRVQGKAGLDPLASMARLSDIYSTPEFYSRVKTALENVAIATQKIGTLSDDLSDLAHVTKTNLQDFNKTLKQTSQEINKTTQQFNITAQEISKLTNNINKLVVDNQASVAKTINSIGNTSDELSKLTKGLQITVAQVNSTDLKKVMSNLETLSVNLRDISSSLNTPTNLLALQQTLDSARVTFANAQKITSDLDELTGDPQFRDNVRKLVNGLGNLVSFSDKLEQELKTAKVLDSLSQQLDQQVEYTQALESLINSNPSVTPQKQENTQVLPQPQSEDPKKNNLEFVK